MACFHEIEEEARLFFFERGIAEFIDKQEIEGLVGFKEFCFRMIAFGLIEFLDESSKINKEAAIALIDSMDEESRGQTGFTATGRTDKDEFLFLGNKAQGVIEIKDELLF